MNTIQKYESWIGSTVSKVSGRPFKSGLKVNTVKGVTDHNVLHIPAFTFFEDDSIVECRRCYLHKDI